MRNEWQLNGNSVRDVAHFFTESLVVYLRFFIEIKSFGCVIQEISFRFIYVDGKFEVLFQFEILAWDF